MRRWRGPRGGFVAPRRTGSHHDAPRALRAALQLTQHLLAEPLRVCAARWAGVVTAANREAWNCVRHNEKTHTKAVALSS